MPHSEDTANQFAIANRDGQDPATGVTNPRKLLKMDTQRIDRNVFTPQQMIQKGILKGKLDPVIGA